MDDEGVDGPGAGSAPATTAIRKGPDRIGARLGAARTAAKIELVDIARDTRVPVRHLRAIEADAHDELPALPYAIGFVKSFARAVGIDPDEAAARFRAETTMVPHAPMAASIEPMDERRLPSRGLAVAAVAGLVVILGGLTAYGAGWFDPATPSAPAATAPVAAAVPPPVQTQTAGSDAPAITEAPAGAEAAAATTTAAVPPTAAPDASTSAAPATGVSILATDDAWIRISRLNPATGKVETVKTGLLGKGQRYDVPAGQTGLKLWTGRAGALRVSVDGRTLPALGGPVETIRNVSLDADALRAAAVRPAAPAAVPGPAAAR